MLKERDLNQIDNLGINKDIIGKQLDRFKNGFPYMKLIRPATENDGIYVLKAHREKRYEETYDQGTVSHSITKFVPASGAASRMFKDLTSFYNEFDIDNDNFDSFVKDNGLKSVKEFFEKLYRFAFYNELMDTIENAGIKYDLLSENEKYKTVLKYLLTDVGLNYNNKPKGLLAFHFYYNKYRTAVSEHLVEGARYARQADGNVNIHFTISQEHRELFEELVDSKIDKYESDFNVKYNISYSYQSASTDTIAVDNNNEPFRNEDGSILFRPGGHGALIENLNKLEEDIIFIKNIDNVVPDFLKQNTIRYKKIIGGLLLTANRIINSYQSRIVAGDYTNDTIEAIEQFIEVQLSVILPKSYYQLDAEKKIEELKRILNRPLRVCGMVKNEGEPGGGPFWVKNKHGEISLQIVESAQVDMNNKDQKDIVSRSTHFNPVDIVCSFKDWSGVALDLNNFIDDNTGFISEKSKDGKTLKALEHPGLWNGAMSDWNTIFVEVPDTTFNPVKTVNDLLRPEHQSLSSTNSN